MHISSSIVNEDIRIISFFFFKKRKTNNVPPLRSFYAQKMLLLLFFCSLVFVLLVAFGWINVFVRSRFFHKKAGLELS